MAAAKVHTFRSCNSTKSYLLLFLFALNKYPTASGTTIVSFSFLSQLESDGDGDDNLHQRQTKCLTATFDFVYYPVSIATTIYYVLVYKMSE